MRTHTITVAPAEIVPQSIEQADRLIRSGQLVAFPTETVYGLGANALDGEAVTRIFEAKGRPTTDPLIVHVRSSEQLAETAIAVPDVAYQLIDKFWPGPLTLVLTRSERISAAVHGGLAAAAGGMPGPPGEMALLLGGRVSFAGATGDPFAPSRRNTASD